MKKLLLVLAIVLLIASPSFALLDTIRNNSPEQDQGQAQGQAQGQGQGQLQGQAQAAIAAQGQGQGQIAVGKVDVQDNSSTKTTAIAFPSTGATEGVASANASYMFGNLGLSDTEMYKKGANIIQTVLAIPDNILEPELKAAIVKDIISKMRESIKPRRLLGIGPEQHSKNLINLFGLLSFDSVWAENQKPFQCKADIK